MSRDQNVIVIVDFIERDMGLSRLLNNSYNSVLG